jgi:hypothetical protein
MSFTERGLYCNCNRDVCQDGVTVKDTSIASAIIEDWPGLDLSGELSLWRKHLFWRFRRDRPFRFGDDRKAPGRGLVGESALWLQRALCCFVALIATNQLVAAHPNRTAHHHPVFSPLFSSENVFVSNLAINEDGIIALGNSNSNFRWDRRRFGGCDRKGCVAGPQIHSCFPFFAKIAVVADQIKRGRRRIFVKGNSGDLYQFIGRSLPKVFDDDVSLWTAISFDKINSLGAFDKNVSTQLCSAGANLLISHVDQAESDDCKKDGGDGCDFILVGMDESSSWNEDRAYRGGAVFLSAWSWFWVWLDCVSGWHGSGNDAIHPAPTTASTTKIAPIKRITSIL